MLQDQGIELGQSSVEQESPNQGDAQNETGQFANNANSASAGVSDEDVNEEPLAPNVIEQRVAGSSLGGIDYFV